MLHSAWLRIVVVALWPLPQLLIGQHPFTSAGFAIAAAAYTACLAGKLFGCWLFTRPNAAPPLKLGPVKGLGVLIVVAMFALQLQAIINDLRALIKAHRVLDFSPAPDQATAP